MSKIKNHSIASIHLKLKPFEIIFTSSATTNPINSIFNKMSNANSNANANATVSESRYEGCGEEGPLRSIFFAEFHPTAGPIIRCQAPAGGPDLIGKDIFDAIRFTKVINGFVLSIISACDANLTMAVISKIEWRLKKEIKSAFLFN